MEKFLGIPHSIESSREGEAASECGATGLAEPETRRDAKMGLQGRQWSRDR